MFDDLTGWQIMLLFIVPFAIGMVGQFLYFRRRVQRRFKEEVVVRMNEEVKRRVEQEVLRRLREGPATDGAGKQPAASKDKPEQRAIS